MSSAQLNNNEPKRQTTSWTSYRTRFGTHDTPPHQSNRLPFLGSGSGSDVDQEIDVVLSSPTSRNLSMSSRLETQVHLTSTIMKRNKFSRTGSQVNIIEVDDSSKDVGGQSTDTDLPRDSWRQRGVAARPAPNNSTVTSNTTHQEQINLVPSSQQEIKDSTAQSRSQPRYGAPDQMIETRRRASIPIQLASFPHASVPSVPYSTVPDLNRIRPIQPALVAEQLLLSEPCQLPRTREFALAPPPYTDQDIPPPTPYNEAYPHPLTSYASPGVNPNTVIQSGYDIDLADLMQNDRAKALGTILATCDRPGITAPTLAKHLRSYIPDGNGIPGFDNEGAARAALGPVGAAMCRGDERLNELTGGGGSGIQPVFTPALGNLPPRLAAQARAESRVRDAHHVPMTSSTMSAPSYRPITPPTSPIYNPGAAKGQGDDYFSTTHPAALRRASVISDLSSTGGDRYLAPHHFRQEAFSILSANAEAYNPTTPSSYYKTELCPAYQEGGSCKYGGGCQFAHGLHELRITLGRSAFTFPENVSPGIPVHQGVYQGQLPPKMDVRKASAPHSNLGTVQETDDYRCQGYTSGRRASHIIDEAHSGDYQYSSQPIRQASIARLAIPRKVDSGSSTSREVNLNVSCSSDLPRTPTQTALSGSFSTFSATPSDRISPSGYQDHMLQNRKSDVSLSQSHSSSGMGAGNSPTPTPKRYDDPTPTRHLSYEDGTHTPTIHTSISTEMLGGQGQYSPTRPHPRSPGGHGGNDASSASSWGSGTGDSNGTGTGTGSNSAPKAKAKINSTSATVDFSAGRSIWC